MAQLPFPYFTWNQAKPAHFMFWIFGLQVWIVRVRVCVCVWTALPLFFWERTGREGSYCINRASVSYLAVNRLAKRNVVSKEDISPIWCLSVAKHHFTYALPGCGKNVWEEAKRTYFAVLAFRGALLQGNNFGFTFRGYFTQRIILIVGLENSCLRRKHNVWHQHTLLIFCPPVINSMMLKSFKKEDLFQVNTD